MAFILRLIMLFFVGVHMLPFLKFSKQMAMIFLSSWCYPETSVTQKTNFSVLPQSPRKTHKGDIFGAQFISLTDEWEDQQRVEMISRKALTHVGRLGSREQTTQVSGRFQNSRTLEIHWKIPPPPWKEDERCQFSRKQNVEAGRRWLSGIAELGVLWVFLLQGLEAA